MAIDQGYDRGGNAGLAFGLGLVAGAMIGVGLGLLFAPKDGAALRRDLAKRAKELQDDAAGWYDQATAVAQEVADDLVDVGRDAAERARTAVNERA
jgi:gas vesicle protein